LKDETEVEPGCVEIMPRKRVTPHVRTWLSEHTDTKNFSDSFTFTTGDLKMYAKELEKNLILLFLEFTNLVLKQVNAFGLGRYFKAQNLCISGAVT
jgi:hypothetical protein